MKAKLTALVDAFLGGLTKIVQSPYRVIVAVLAVLYTMDLITQREGGPLDFTIAKLKQAGEIASSIETTALLLIVIGIYVLVNRPKA